MKEGREWRKDYVKEGKEALYEGREERLYKGREGRKDFMKEGKKEKRTNWKLKRIVKHLGNEKMRVKSSYPVP